MNLFGIPEAQHYCVGFSRTAGQPSGSLRQYVQQNLNGVVALQEGSAAFAAYRDCSLREVERMLFLAVSQYRRSLDLMLSSSSYWAYVALYYCSYYAATALMGVFGGTIARRTVIDVGTQAPGNQEIRIKRNATPKGLGSHQAFWSVFYNAVQPLHVWVEPTLLFAIQPISGSDTWQIDNRNLVNYDSYESCRLIAQFEQSFRRRHFPTTLPGILNTQFRVADGLMQITCTFVRQFQLRTDALKGFGPTGRRSTKIRHLIFRDAPPALAHRIRRRTIVV